VLRTEDALEVQLDIIAAGCPFYSHYDDRWNKE
jgi:hypothetical protein